MQQKTLQALYGYWNELRAGRLAPQRLEIEPSRIAGILSETFMLERIDAATYRYRLAGTRLCEMFGSELRGKNFLHDWRENDRHVLERDLATVCDEGGVCVIRLEGSSDSRHRVEFEAVLLPLVHTGQSIGRIIGAMSATSAPHWLASEPLLSRRLQSHEIIWPDEGPHAAVGRPSRQARAAGAGTDAHRRDRPPPVSRFRRRPHELQVGQALARGEKAMTAPISLLQNADLPHSSAPTSPNGSPI